MRRTSASAHQSTAAVSHSSHDYEALALMRTSPLAAVISDEHRAPIHHPAGTSVNTGAFRATHVRGSQAAAAVAHARNGGQAATQIDRTDCMERQPSADAGAAGFDAAIAAIADDVLRFKSSDLERRPEWRAPEAPTPRQVDSLVVKVRALAFPEYYSARPSKAASTSGAAGASPSFDTAIGASVRTHAADRALMRELLREVSAMIQDLTQRALIIDAIEADANAGNDPDLPEHLRHCKLGDGVRSMSGDAVEAIAAAHTRSVVLPKVLQHIPGIVRSLNADVTAAHELDVATSSRAEVALTYPGVTALLYHRLAHALLKSGAPVMLCRFISERSHAKTGVDIHPGVSIGPGCFIDHGTGLVIGGTAEIGANVCLFHGVTLGSKAFPTDASGNRIKHLKRHPIVEDGASIYAGATVLGRVTIGRGATVAAGVTLAQDLPAGHVAANPRGATQILPPKEAPSPS